MKILNLYAGIGGNRRLWENVKVTAIEQDPQIAEAYQKLFPKDKVIVGDAHKYLEDHFQEFDFIWASPPCPSHSCVRKVTSHQNKPIFPDMKLYEEILFLKHYFKGKYCVENVMPYYKPLVEAKKLDRHLFWTNFPLNEKRFNVIRRHEMSLEEFEKVLGVNVRGIVDNDKLRYVYRNCVDSNVGKFILDSAYNERQESLFSYVTNGGNC